MGKLELQQMVLGPVYTNCYIAKNKETGEALIIDPADSPSKIELKVNAMGARPVAVLLTHGHFDHIMGVEAVREKYQIPVYACRQEEEMLREPSVNMTDQMGKSCSIRPDVFLDDLTVEMISEALGTEIVVVDEPGADLVDCLINPPDHKKIRRRQIYEQTSSSDSGETQCR